MREAAAQHAGHRLLDLRVGRLRILIEERLGGQDDAVQAEAALRGLLVDERLLDRMRLLDGAEPFERRDLGARHRDCTGVTQERIACPSTMTVQAPHWPRPQPNFGPAQRQIVAEHVEQRRRRIDVHGVLPAVHLQRDRHEGLLVWREYNKQPRSTR